ncbi:MAG: hydrogenase expression/formation protein HypE [Desulfosarcina sp.]|nr:hydrogenase expression/formation protein HypE [Desulfobacterales bacterium]
MEKNKIRGDLGGGGKSSYDFVKDILLPVFDNPYLSKLDDGAVFDINGTRCAFSTDTFVADPIFFPGGTIGDLAVNGTVNDISMCGGEPMYISTGLIIEEDFSMDNLEIILKDMKAAADNANVKIVTGDTKVVPKGAVDKIFINTSGIGVVPKNITVSCSNAKPGDKIILSGTIGDHGIAMLTCREGMEFETKIKSDTASLCNMVKNILPFGKSIHVLRDPTRGGVGTVLNEIALKSHAGILFYEDKIPVKKKVAGICEILGLDPLYIANEGKLIAVVESDDAAEILESVKNDPFGADAVIIGEVVSDFPGQVVMKTRIGGKRIVDMLSGEQLPRIC